MTEHVLDYDRSRVTQETGYNCGPASAQTVLAGAGIRVEESQIARECGTDADGTDYVGLIERALNNHCPGQYASVYLEHDPPSREQKETLWRNLVSSIDGGYGVVMNWVAPPGNHPRGVKGSVGPNYGGSTVWHYVAAMGYDDDPSLRAVWIADSGFQPQGYWVSFDQCASLIPPKGYCYATAVRPAPIPAPQAPSRPPSSVNVGYESRSGYRTPNEGPIGGVDVFTVNDDAMLHVMFVELSATLLGDPESIHRIARAAVGWGADTSPDFVARARRVLSRVQRDDLAAAVARFQQTDPALFKALGARG